MVLRRYHTPNEEARFYPVGLPGTYLVLNHSHHLTPNCQVGETGVSWDTFHFFSNIAENMYDRDFDLTLQGRGILPLQTGLISFVVTSFVATEYGVNDTWSNCPNLPRHGVGWDSTRGT